MQHIFFDTFDVQTKDRGWVQVTGLINPELFFGLVVDDGKVDVIHLATGARISTENGFATLKQAFKFIDMIYPLKAWADDKIEFTQDETDKVVAAYHEACKESL